VCSQMHDFGHAQQLAIPRLVVSASGERDRQGACSNSSPRISLRWNRRVVTTTRLHHTQETKHGWLSLDSQYGGMNQQAFDRQGTACHTCVAIGSTRATLKTADMQPMPRPAWLQLEEQRRKAQRNIHRHSTEMNPESATKELSDCLQYIYASQVSTQAILFSDIRLTVDQGISTPRNLTFPDTIRSRASFALLKGNFSIRQWTS